ncbi:hypothetical protein HK102_005610 [Quaeritorhiza haematococci]|nr:hypothetical protein HK102_005610 [Quaeritorhiza haematococci]
MQDTKSEETERQIRQWLLERFPEAVLSPASSPTTSVPTSLITNVTRKVRQPRAPSTLTGSTSTSPVRQGQVLDGAAAASINGTSTQSAHANIAQQAPQPPSMTMFNFTGPQNWSFGTNSQQFQLAGSPSTSSVQQSGPQMFAPPSVMNTAGSTRAENMSASSLAGSVPVDCTFSLTLSTTNATTPNNSTTARPATFASMKGFLSGSGDRAASAVNRSSAPTVTFASSASASSAAGATTTPSWQSLQVGATTSLSSVASASIAGATTAQARQTSHVAAPIATSFGGSASATTIQAPQISRVAATASSSSVRLATLMGANQVQNIPATASSMFVRSTTAASVPGTQGGRTSNGAATVMVSVRSTAANGASTASTSSMRSTAANGATTASSLPVRSTAARTAAAATTQSGQPSRVQATAFSSSARSATADVGRAPQSTAERLAYVNSLVDQVRQFATAQAAGSSGQTRPNQTASLSVAAIKILKDFLQGLVNRDPCKELKRIEKVFPKKVVERLLRTAEEAAGIWSCLEPEANADGGTASSSSSSANSSKPDTRSFAALMAFLRCALGQTEDPECPVCFETFGPTRGAVIPACGHILCQECITHFFPKVNYVAVKNPRTGSIEELYVVSNIADAALKLCPFCRVPILKRPDLLVAANAFTAHDSFRVKKPKSTEKSSSVPRKGFNPMTQEMLMDNDPMVIDSDSESEKPLPKRVAPPSSHWSASSSSTTTTTPVTSANWSFFANRGDEIWSTRQDGSQVGAQTVNANFANFASSGRSSGAASWMVNANWGNVGNGGSGSLGVARGNDASIQNQRPAGPAQSVQSTSAPPHSSVFNITFNPFGTGNINSSTTGVPAAQNPFRSNAGGQYQQQPIQPPQQQQHQFRPFGELANLGLNISFDPNPSHTGLLGGVTLNTSSGLTNTPTFPFFPTSTTTVPTTTPWAFSSVPTAASSSSSSSSSSSTFAPSFNPLIVNFGPVFSSSVSSGNATQRNPFQNLE